MGTKRGTRTRWIAVTVGVAVPAFLAGPVLFPAAPELPTPVGMQLPLLLGVLVVEALALGLAVAFLAFGWPLVRAVADPERPRAVAAYLSSAWLLGNWWLHDNLHIWNGTDLNGLIAIDYAFHVTIIAASVIVAWQLLRSVQAGRLAVSRTSERLDGAVGV